MNKFLQMIGWKDYRNKWDRFEITTDVIIITIVGTIVYVAMQTV